MITVPIAASSPYRSYSDGSKVVKEPLVRASEDHPSSNAQVRVYFIYRVTQSRIQPRFFFFFFFFFPKLPLKLRLILCISVLRKFRNYISAPVIGNDVACLFTSH